jgi:hypothetical protein
MSSWTNFSTTLATITLLGFLGCDRKAPVPATEGPAPSASAAPPAEAPAPVATEWVDPNPIRPIDAGPPDWYKCQRPDECVVVTAGRCCAPCNAVPFEGYSAVNVKHKDDFMAFKVADTCPCPRAA